MKIFPDPEALVREHGGARKWQRTRPDHLSPSTIPSER